MPATGSSTAVLSGVAAKAGGRSWRSGWNGVGQLLDALGHSVHLQLVGVVRSQREFLLETAEGAGQPGEFAREFQEADVSISSVTHISDLLESLGDKLEEAGNLKTLLLY